METLTDTRVDEWRREAGALERALLRRGVKDRYAGCERCSRCHRTPLVGERVYLSDGGPMVCALCRSGQTARELNSRVVRFGSAIRVIADRAA